MVDEGTSALDPEPVGEILNVVRMLADRSDMTMPLVTHEMGFARDDADRVLVFDHGQIVEQGPPDTIFTNPSHRRAQRFLKAIIEHV